jgi:ParB family chromosome partitioning protein
MSKDNVYRYIRANELVDELKSRFDKDEFSLRAAVDVSYLRKDEQIILNRVLGLLDENEVEAYKLDMKTAKELRTASENNPLRPVGVFLQYLIYCLNTPFVCAAYRHVSVE